MPKKTKREKILARLHRREIQFIQKPDKKPNAIPVLGEVTVDTAAIGRDLKKTFLITLLAIGAQLVLRYVQK